MDNQTWIKSVTGRKAHLKGSTCSYFARIKGPTQTASSVIKKCKACIKRLSSVKQHNNNSSNDDNNIEADIYEYLLTRESLYMPDPSYLNLHFCLDERKRTIVVDWMVEVLYKCQAKTETLYLAVNILDRMFSKYQNVKKNDIQDFASSAMFLACKYQEVDCYNIKQFVRSDINDISKVLKSELKIINALGFCFTIVTPLELFTYNAMLTKFNTYKQLIGRYFLELTLLHYETLKYKPSVLATAATYLVNKRNYVVNEETKECADLMLKYANNPNKDTFVYKKYNSESFHNIASIDFKTYEI